MCVCVCLAFLQLVLKSFDLSSFFPQGHPKNLCLLFHVWCAAFLWDANPKIVGFVIFLVISDYILITYYYHYHYSSKSWKKVLQPLAPFWLWSSAVSVLITRCQTKKWKHVVVTCAVLAMIQCSICSYHPVSSQSWQHVAVSCAVLALIKCNIRSYQGLWKSNLIRDKAILVLFSGAFVFFRALWWWSPLHYQGIT